MHARDLAIVELAGICLNLGTQGMEVLGRLAGIPTHDMFARIVSTMLQRKGKSQFYNRLLFLAHVPMTPSHPNNCFTDIVAHAPQ